MMENNQDMNMEKSMENPNYAEIADHGAMELQLINQSLARIPSREVR